MLNFGMINTESFAKLTLIANNQPLTDIWRAKGCHTSQGELTFVTPCPVFMHLANNFLISKGLTNHQQLTTTKQIQLAQPLLLDIYIRNSEYYEANF